MASTTRPSATARPPSWNPFNSAGHQHRALSYDDEVAASAIYDTWEGVTGQARDIGVTSGGSSERVWVIGSIAASNNYRIHQWDTSTSSWNTTDGAAVRIAVDVSGYPWVINNAGSVFKRTSTTWNTGSWKQVAGCAKDIGAFSDSSVWIVSCDSAYGGYTVKKWTKKYESDATKNWTTDTSGAAAVRISVATNGRPWVVNSFKQVFRRTSTDPASGTWDGPLPGAANDIDAGKNGYTYIISNTATGGGYTIQVWDEQPAAAGGSPPPPAKYEWLTIPNNGGATNIAAGAVRPWVINSSLQIFRNAR